MVYVLHVGAALVRRVVGLGAAVGVGRVALRVVDVFVSPEDVEALAVVVGAAEIVVVVVRGVSPYGVEHRLRHLALNLLEEVLVTVKLLLLGVVQAVIAHVLHRPCALGGGEGIGLRGLCGYLSPLGVGETL